MASITIEITGDSMDDIMATVRSMLPEKDQNEELANMSLQELLLYTSQRADADGYDMEVRKREEAVGYELREGLREEEPAPAKKAAKAKLKTSLEESVKEIERQANRGNGHVETDDDRKKRCVKRLQEMFYEGRKDEVRKLLKAYGDGAKNFQSVPVERFAEISQALEEL